ncbi:hypothetical protein ACFO1B_55155 [Dactylosporangium siamense]|uniref:hypothetical protein n=1 Tax=Dactylosporangium siamense TaxID=685454 RepID=UPI0019422C50|nr:hypothetical protein [Dactylosporangium siamense]
MDDEAAWWRGQAAGIPPKAPDSDGFPLWPTTTTTTVRAPSPDGEHSSSQYDSQYSGSGSEPGSGPGSESGSGPGTEPAGVPGTAVVPAGLAHDLVDPAAHDAGAAAVVEHLQVATTRLEETAAQLADAGESWPPPAMRVMRRPRDAAVTSPPPKRSPRKVRRLRNPAFGLPAMLVIALLAGFFAWTSAEPFWLDMGQGEHGHAQITRCKGDGVLRRCYATFQSDVRAAVAGVPLVGADDAPGTTLDARMRAGGRIAYAGNPSGLRVRWTVGLALILLCGAALCWATGAGRLGRLRTRLAAYAVTVAAPLVLGLGVLIASY